MTTESELPDTTAAELEAAKADLAAAADALLAGVPEHLRPLIPGALSAKERIDWFAQAKATGIFDRTPVPPTGGGEKPTITPKQADANSLPAFARMAAGYQK